MTKKAARKKPPAKKNTGGQGGGVNISGKGSVTIAGDVVGRDKITTTADVGAGPLIELMRQFQQIQQRIESLPIKPDVKDDLRTNVERIKDETQKGNQANASDVERWLMNLGAMSDDIFQVTVNSLTNPSWASPRSSRKLPRRPRKKKPNAMRSLKSGVTSPKF